MSSAPRSCSKQAWDENADPFTNAVRITVSALRKRLGEPGIIATVAGVGYRIGAQQTRAPRRLEGELSSPRITSEAASRI